MINVLPLAVGGAGLWAALRVGEVMILERHQRRKPWKFVRLYVPQDVEHPGKERMLSLLNALWSKLQRTRFQAIRYGHMRVVCGFKADAGGIYQYWGVPAEDWEYLCHLIRTCLPGVDPEPITSPLEPEVPAGKVVAVVNMRPMDGAAFPLADFDRHFSAQLLRLLEACRGDAEVGLQLLLRPVRAADWVPRAKADLLTAEGKRAENGGSWLDGLKAFIPAAGEGAAQQPAPKIQTTRMERLATKDTPAKLLSNGFDAQLRLVAVADSKEEATRILAQVTGLVHTLSGTNHLLPQWPGFLGSPARLYREIAKQHGPVRAGDCILTADEILSIMNPAPAQVKGEPGVRVIELKAPPSSEGIHLVDGSYRGKRVAVRLQPEDLDTHLAIMGKTGHGKGVIQEHLFRECAKLGMGGVYIDPLGGSVRKLLGSLPDSRMDDVIYIEAGNDHWAAPLNPLAVGAGDDEEAVASEAVNLYHRLWSDAWGHSTAEALRAASIAIIQSGGSLPEVELVLTNPDYRRAILQKVRHAGIRHYLENLPDKVTESLRPPLNKLHELLWQESILAMLGQPDSLDWRTIIKERRLVLVNLNKGNPRIGPLGAALFAGLIWSRIGRAGLSIPVDGRVRFLLVADEVKDVASRTPEDFEQALSQYRQFLMPVVAAGQYPRQLPEKLVNGITGNVGSKLVLREDSDHALDCIKLVGGQGTLKDVDLVNLPPLVGFANLTAGKRPTGVFTCWAPPYSQAIRDPDEAATRSFERWSRPRQQALDEINKRIEAAAGTAGARPELN